MAASRCTAGTCPEVRPVRSLPLLLALIVLCLATGCSAGSANAQARHTTSASNYWNRARLLDAVPFAPSDPDLPPPRPSASARPAHDAGALRVGALFLHSSSGNHFCTASVVASPGGNVLITAAHCLNRGKGSHVYNSDIVFIPGYRDGQAPFGVWTPSKLIVARQWVASSDPDFDVGFVVLQPHDGKNIQQILGADRIALDDADRYQVHVTGYPASSDSPITCDNTTTLHSATQLQFDCAGFTGGTSGSPWVTRYRPSTQSGTIVGVVGGYEEGGDTPSISYSVRFGPDILRLYRRAVAAAAGRHAA